MTIQTEQLKQLLAGYAKVPETEASAFVDALVDTLVQHLKQGEEVTVAGLGTFYFVENQQGRRVAFRAEEKMKEAINAPFSFFEPVVISEGKKNLQSPEPVPEEETVEVIEEPAEVAADPVEESVEAVEAVEEPKEPEEPEDPEEPETSPGPVTTDDQEDSHPATPGKGWWILATVLLLVACGVYFWMETGHGAEPATASYTTPVETSPVVAAIPAADTLSVVDSLPVVAVRADSVVEAKPEPVVEAKPESVVEVKKVPKKRAPKPTDEQVLHEADGTPRRVQLGEGGRLTLLSERIYGDKSFWAYIYEVNAFQLRSPNVVPCSVHLYLPDPDYYKIDAKDSLSVRRAKQLQKDILKQLE